MTTNKWTRDDVWTILRTNDDQVGRAVVALYQRQTEDEQQTSNTNERNGAGFNGVDAPFLSSIAEQYLRKGYLTAKQADATRKTIKKYIGQLTEIANQREAAKHEHGIVSSEIAGQ